MLSFCFCWDAQISRKKTCADLKKIYIEGSERYPYLQGGPVLFLFISQHVFKFIGKKKQLLEEKRSDYLKKILLFISTERVKTMWFNLVYFFSSYLNSLQKDPRHKKNYLLMASIHVCTESIFWIKCVETILTVQSSPSPSLAVHIHVRRICVPTTGSICPQPPTKKLNTKAAHNSSKNVVCLKTKDAQRPHLLTWAILAKTL